MIKKNILKEEGEEEIEVMGAGDAAKFPIVASAMLFGLYLMI